MASISGVDKAIYESARIDGASKLQRIFKITLPMIRPMIIMMVLLSASRRTLPEKYLTLCQEEILWEQAQEKLALSDTQIMALPCSPETDVRSVPIEPFAEGETISLFGSIVNSRGSLWYITDVGGETGYVYSGYLGEVPQVAEEEPPQEPSFWSRVLGWFGG